MSEPVLDLSRLEGLLVDLDGVLWIGEEPIPGAVEAIQALSERGLALRFVTNTTTRPQSALLSKLVRLGVPVTPGQLFTPATLARRAMEERGGGRYRLLAHEALVEDLGPGRIDLDDEATPEWVVMGLHAPSFVHDVLRVGFRDLIGGARLLALHVNRVWRPERGLEPGLGAYVRALEYAANVEALAMGKPSAAFYEQATTDLGLPRDRLAMVGDDVETDVGGAQAVGVAGILVRTGKFTPRSLEISGITPALVVDDVVDLAHRFDGERGS